MEPVCLWCSGRAMAVFCPKPHACKTKTIFLFSFVPLQRTQCTSILKKWRQDLRDLSQSQRIHQPRHHGSNNCNNNNSKQFLVKIPTWRSLNFFESLPVYCFVIHAWQCLIRMCWASQRHLLGQCWFWNNNALDSFQLSHDLAFVWMNVIDDLRCSSDPDRSLPRLSGSQDEI